MNNLLKDRNIVIGYALCSAVVLLSIIFVFFINFDALYFMPIALVAIGLAPIIRSIAKKTDYFEIINVFCLLFVFSIGVRGLMIINSESVWLTSYDSGTDYYRQVLLHVFIYGSVALLALYLGYWSQIGKKIAGKLPRVSFFPAEKRTLLTTSAIALAIGAIGVYIFLAEAGGMGVMSASSTMIEEGIESGGGLYYSLLLDFSVIGILFLYIGKIGMRKGLSEKILLMAFGVIIGFNFLILPFKGHVIGIILYMMIAWNYLKKKVSMKGIVLAILAILLLLPLLNNYRKYGADNLDLMWSESKTEYNSPAFINDNFLGRSAGADMFFLALDRTPEPNPYLYGSSLTKIFTSFIPRPLYPDKAWSFGLDFSNNYLDTPLIAVISPSTIGELYINFHVVGIIAGFFVIGVFLRTVYTYCISNGVTKGGVIIYAVIMEKMIMLVDGPVSDFIVFVLIRLFPVAVLGLLATMLSAKSAERRIVEYR